MTQPDNQDEACEEAAQDQECWTCSGQGWVAGIGADPLPSGEPGEPYQTQETCPDCGGSGVAVGGDGAATMLRDFLDEIETLCEDNGQNAILVEDLQALVRDRLAALSVRPSHDPA